MLLKTKRQQRLIPAKLSESLVSLSKPYDGGTGPALRISSVFSFLYSFQGNGVQKHSQNPEMVRQTVTIHKSLDADADFHAARSGLAP